MDSEIVKQDVVDYMTRIQGFASGEIGEIQKEAMANKVPIIPPETARFIGVVLSGLKPCKILEIGCAVGFSSSFMSTYLQEGGKVITIDRSPVMIEQAKKNYEKLGLGNKITLLEGDAKEVLKTLDEEFDFIFMDAGKGQYINIINDCFRLLRKGGILIADDIFQNGSITKDVMEVEKRQRTIHRRLNSFVEKISNNEGLETSLVPIGDGILLVYKKDSNVIIDVS